MYGVTYGSVPGRSMLFLLYTANHKELFMQLRSNKYADDTQLYGYGRPVDTIVHVYMTFLPASCTDVRTMG